MRLKEKESSQEKLLQVLEEKSRKFEKELTESENNQYGSKKEIEMLR